MRFTERGREGALEGLVVMAEMEREISASLGAGELGAFRDALTRVHAGLSQVSQPK